ncbi:MAG: hypothetical protein E7254_00355 [Lachnospiraceae bacterium]|nr:hypothetical protein [Lachnospiraceae bacterium]
MRLKFSTKKLVAVVSAVAMVFTSIAYTPSTASAATKVTGDLDVGGWHLYAANGSWIAGDMNYTGTGSTFEDMEVEIVNTSGQPGSWGLQAKYMGALASLTAGTKYDLTFNVNASAAGKLFVKTQDSSTWTVDVPSGTSQVSKTFTRAESGIEQNLVFELSGMAAGTKVSFSDLSIEVHDSSQDPEKPVYTNIVETLKWHGWFEAEGWQNYDISDTHTGYTLTNKGLGANWYSIQTGIDAVPFEGNKNYVCRFDLTTSAPKVFKVDNRLNDAVIFTERAGGEWKDNGDGTYTYTYIGDYASAIESEINVRVSLGHFTNDTGAFPANGTITATLSNFVIMTAENYAINYDEEETTVEETTVEETSEEVSTAEETSEEVSTAEETSEEVTTVEETSEEVSTAEETSEEVTTVETPDPIEVFGLGITRQNEAAIAFSWGQSLDQIDLGQSYNVYIDGEFYNNFAMAQEVEYTFATEGIHVIRVTAKLGDKETEGATVEYTFGNVTTVEETSEEVSTVEETSEEVTTVEETSEEVSTVEETSEEVSTVEETSEEVSTVEETSTEEVTTAEETSTEEVTTVEETSTEEVSTVEETSTEEVSTVEETSAVDTTTVAPTTQAPTTAAPTTVAPTTKAEVKAPGKASVKSAKRAKSKKKVKITINKLKGAVGYEIQLSKSKKFSKKTKVGKSVFTKKLTKTIKKLKVTKKLYVRVRAYVLDAKGEKVYGAWSKVKKAK